MKIIQLMKRNLDKIIIISLLIIVLLAVSIKYYLNNNSDKIDLPNETTELKNDNTKDSNKKKDEEEISKIYVDIKGAVKQPGVYEIESNKKVIDVVYMAGGLTDEADTTLINLAKKLIDEMVIIIYTKDQIKEAKKNDLLSTTINDTCVCPQITNDACINNQSSQNNNSKKSSSNNSTSTSNSNNSSTSTEKININTATLEELQTLSGIGESKAKAIIEYREENGNFSKPEDILNVSGIGESVYEKIKDNITV